MARSRHDGKDALFSLAGSWMGCASCVRSSWGSKLCVDTCAHALRAVQNCRRGCVIGSRGHHASLHSIPCMDELWCTRSCMRAMCKLGEEGMPPAPVAHHSLRRLELDSDSDSEDENDGGQLGVNVTIQGPKRSPRGPKKWLGWHACGQGATLTSITFADACKADFLESDCSLFGHVGHVWTSWDPPSVRHTSERRERSGNCPLMCPQRCE